MSCSCIDEFDAVLIFMSDRKGQAKQPVRPIDFDNCGPVRDCDVRLMALLPAVSAEQRLILLPFAIS